MQMGIDVPRVYIVPVERFCREQGPSLGVNLAVRYFGPDCLDERCVSLNRSRNLNSQHTLHIL